MAVLSRPLLLFVNGIKQKLDSNAAEILFKSISVTADGNNNGMEIKEVAGAFDFNARALSNVGNVDGRDVSTDGATLDAHLNGGASKHDATEVDYERTDGSKKDILAASDDVESALTNLDDNKISRNGTIDFAGDQSMGGFKLLDVGAPVDPTDAANKAYVDAVATGLDVKASVRAATTGALPSVNYANGTAGVGATLTATANGALPAQDGITLIVGDRLLVKDQVAGLLNSIYTVTAVGDGSNPFILTRATDADEAAETTAGMFTFVEEGTSSADTGWVLSTDNPITMGTTALAFTQFSSAGQIIGGAGLLKTGNTLDVQAADNSITVNVDSIQVKLNTVTTVGNIIVTATGITSDTDGLTLETVANRLQVIDLGITAAKLATDSVTTVKIVDANVTAAKLATDSVTTVKIVDANVTAAKLATDSVTTVKIVDANVTLAKLASLSVDESKLTASVAGAGLSGGAGSALAVSIDSDTTEIIADIVKVKHTRTLANNSGVAIASGDLVYINASGEILKAIATNASSHNFELAVAAAAIADTASGLVYVRRGAIIAGYTGLTPGKKQYVSAVTAGARTETAPSASTQHVYMLGRALSATEILYAPEHEVEIL